MADTKKKSRGLAWLAAAVPIVVIATIVGGYQWLEAKRADENALDNATAAQSQIIPDLLTPGKDYYLYIQTIELYPKQPNGKPWDRTDKSAPDIQYSLDWQDQEIFRSPQRENGLIATWDGISVDVRKALMDGKLEPSTTLNDAATINVPKVNQGGDGELLIHVWDEDVIGLGRDAAGEVRVKLNELYVGDNVIWLEKSQYNGIRRIVLRATATDQPVKNLLEALSAP